jgi:hypothetical protein
MMATDDPLEHLARRLAGSRRRPKRKVMQAFKIDEISIVDKPAQEGAVATILKADMPFKPIGDAIMSAYDPAHIAKAAKDREQRNLRNAPAEEVEYHDPNDAESEFEKEPTSEGEDNGGVPYRGKPRRGDWPPHSDDPGSGVDHDEDTRTDGFTSGDEDEELRAAMVQNLMRTNKRMSPQMAELMADGRLADMQKFAGRLNTLAKGVTPQMPHMGREREYRRRAIEANVSKLRAANRNLGYSKAMQITKARFPFLFS